MPRSVRVTRSCTVAGCCCQDLRRYARDHIACLRSCRARAVGVLCSRTCSRRAATRTGLPAVEAVEGGCLRRHCRLTANATSPGVSQSTGCSQSSGRSNGGQPLPRPPAGHASRRSTCARAASAWSTLGRTGQRSAASRLDTRRRAERSRARALLRPTLPRGLRRLASPHLRRLYQHCCDRWLPARELLRHIAAARARHRAWGDRTHWRYRRCRLSRCGAAP